MDFKDVMNNAPAILTEGPIIERLKREFHLNMDDSKTHLDLVYNQEIALRKIYSEYLEIGKTNNLPILITTPTRRINKDTMQFSNKRNSEVIKDTCRFYNTLKQKDSSYSKSIFIGGLLGCRGDGYSGKQQMTIEESYQFHKSQTEAFKDQNIQFLMASLLPEINEAIGLAKVLSESGLPYIISFMLHKNGGLLDGTLLTDAIQSIDAAVETPPVYYMANCIHPSNLIKALKVEGNFGNPYLNRFKGIQANASSLSPEELEGAKGICKDSDDLLVEEMLALRTDFNIKIFGGCCGTNKEFLNMLALKIE